MATIDWIAEEPAKAVHSWDELKGELIAISRTTSRDSGIGAILQKPSSQELVVVMAGDLWWLDWFPEDYTEHFTGTYHTVAEWADSDTPLQDTEVVTFFLHGHHGEVPYEHTVAKGQALDAIAEFLENVELPRCLRWSPD